jgi:hypothetical protein
VAVAHFGIEVAGALFETGEHLLESKEDSEKRWKNEWEKKHHKKAHVDEPTPAPPKETTPHHTGRVEKAAGFIEDVIHDTFDADSQDYYQGTKTDEERKARTRMRKERLRQRKLEEESFEEDFAYEDGEIPAGVDSAEGDAGQVALTAEEFVCMKTGCTVEQALQALELTTAVNGCENPASAVAEIERMHSEPSADGTAEADRAAETDGDVCHKTKKCQSCGIRFWYLIPPPP